MTIGRIETNPCVMLGKPVIRGTRITVELLLYKLREGATVRELLEAYPRLQREDISAALTYAMDASIPEEDDMASFSAEAARRILEKVEW